MAAMFTADASAVSVGVFGAIMSRRGGMTWVDSLGSMGLTVSDAAGCPCPDVVPTGVHGTDVEMGEASMPDVDDGVSKVVVTVRVS